MSVPMTAEEYNIYFSGEKENISVIDISKLSIISGQLTAMDYDGPDYAGGEYTPAYTETIPNGEYAVKASLLNCGEGAYRVAAAKIEFASEKPVGFKMAVYENQDISKLKEGYFYGFAIDSGLAIIGDKEVINEYCEVLEQFEEESEGGNNWFMSSSLSYYETHIEKMLEDSYSKFPEYHVDFIDYTLPETEHHMLFLSTGWGDGTYPVYFGYSESGKLCCAVVQFIFEDELKD